MKPKTKFDWIAAVAGDARLKVAERFVLTNIAVKYVMAGDDGTFKVRQATIADRFAVSERTVKRAIATARQFGYIELVAVRTSRGPTHHGADRYRLSIPELRDNESPNSGGDGAELGDSIDRVRGQNRQSYGTESTELGDWTEPPTSGNDVPIRVLYKGFTKDFREGTAPAAESTESDTLPAVPRTPSLRDELLDQNATFIDAEIVDTEDDPPQRYCKRHPNGTDDPCGACGDRKRRYREWQDRQAHDLLARLADERTARAEQQRRQRASQPTCTWCKDTRIVLNNDGTTGTRPRRCHCDGSWHSMTDIEIHEHAELIEQLNRAGMSA